MPLFQLPFHLRSIAQGAAAGFGCGLLLIGLTLLAERRAWRFRELIELLLTLRWRAIPEERRFTLFRITMYILGLLMLCLGLFYGLVLLGVIQNGPPPSLPFLLPRPAG